MRCWLVPFIFYVTLTSGEYTPGTPGGPWTLDDILIVRAKLWSLMVDSQSQISYQKVPLDQRPITGKDIDNSTDDDAFMSSGFSNFPGKLLRLGFHDCLRYSDGSGGCDGCLDWSGMGYRFPPHKEMKCKFKEKDVLEGDNNGLEYTVGILELIYTDKNFPFDIAPSLDTSLQSSGKSRADLWAYAAKVAIEYTVERNNYHCEEKPTDDWNGSYIGTSHDCLRYPEDPHDCKVILSREISFSYGRTDCISFDSTKPFKTSKGEAKPNPNGNGDETLDFFKSNFSFNARETVAIMGGHTLGGMSVRNSLFKYAWTPKANHLFNNEYYRNFVNEKDWFIENKDDYHCDLVGDANGTKPDIKWVPTMEGYMEHGGSIQWIRMHFACPNCIHKWKENKFRREEWDKCCVGIPDNKSCIPDNKIHIPGDVTREDDVTGCERYRFTYGNDEMAINAEIGLYFQFNQENGIPKVGPNDNCKGFKNFIFSKKNKMKDRCKNDGFNSRYMKSRRIWDHGCGLNMRTDENSDIPVSQYFVMYAKDQATWIEDFIPTFEKMTRNGYHENDLKTAPYSWQNVLCSKNDEGVIVCS